MILILGRFQPFHNGHLKVIKDAMNYDHNIIIAIGSPGKSNTSENPFSGDERKLMMDATLSAHNIPAKVFLIPDTPTDEGYVRHVEAQINCRPKKIITENPWSIDLFGKAGYEIITPERHFELSATDIRRRIAEGKKWEHLVPKEVTKFLNKGDRIERIKRTQAV